MRRRYPQIYSSSQRYKLDVGSIVLGPQDFGCALRTIVPAAQRALAPPGRALSCTLQPLLERSLAHTLTCLLRVFPHAELPHREQTHGMDSTPGWDITVSESICLNIISCNVFWYICHLPNRSVIIIGRYQASAVYITQKSVKQICTDFVILNFDWVELVPLVFDMSDEINYSLTVSSGIFLYVSVIMQIPQLFAVL